MSPHLVIGLLLSAAIGLSLGLIGGGGSIITVPVLVYVIGVEPHEAVAMSLGVVGVTSAIGAALHHRRGSVRLKTGATFGASGVLGAYFGSRLTYLLSPAALLLSFAALMLIVSAAMIVRKPRAETTARHRRGSIKPMLVGLLIGFLTGFLGVGGGFLVVPALALFGGLSMKEAIGTSLLVIAINCAAGLAGHLSHGAFDLRLAALVTALAAAGTLIGTALSHKASPAILRRGFAIFVIMIAVFLVAKNYAVFL